MKRGDIIFVDFDPTKGHEQAGNRPALVLSPAAFVKMTGLAVVIPITNTVRHFPFECALNNTKTTGVALCHQIRTIDIKVRNCKFIESAPEAVVMDALARVRAIFN